MMMLQLWNADPWGFYKPGFMGLAGKNTGTGPLAAAKNKTCKPGFQANTNWVCGFEKLAGYPGIQGPVNPGLHSLAAAYKQNVRCKSQHKELLQRVVHKKWNIHALHRLSNPTVSEMINLNNCRSC